MQGPTDRHDVAIVGGGLYGAAILFHLAKAGTDAVGSLLVEPAQFIEKARLNRQMIGGGMRQAGIVAAAGVYALGHNVERLADDHANARRLARALAEMPGISVTPAPVETNILFAEVEQDDLSAQDFARALRADDVLVNVPGSGRRGVRFVTHYGIEQADIDEAIRVATDILGRASDCRRCGMTFTDLAHSYDSWIEAGGYELERDYPSAEYQARLVRARAWMAESDLDGLVITSSVVGRRFTSLREPYEWHDICQARSAWYVLSHDRDILFMTSTAAGEHLNTTPRSTWVSEIHGIVERSGRPGRVEIWALEQMPPYLAELGLARGRLGFELGDCMTLGLSVADFLRLRELMPP